MLPWWVTEPARASDCRSARTKTRQGWDEQEWEKKEKNEERESFGHGKVGSRPRQVHSSSPQDYLLHRYNQYDQL